MAKRFLRSTVVTALVAAVGSAVLLSSVGGTAQAATVAGTYNALTPARVLDTRIGNGAPTAPVGPFGALHLQVAGRGGVPASGAGAVTLNVTVTAPQAGGYLTAYPADRTRPTASNLNFVRDQTVANLVTVPVGADGAVDLYNGSPGTVHLVADVNGWFAAGAASAPGAFAPLPPTRVLDTRNGGGPVSAMQTVPLQVTGQGGVPSTAVAAVALNLTVTETKDSGYLTAYPAGSPRPTASNVNFSRGQTVSNATIVPVGAGGVVDLFNGSPGADQLVADVSGYYLAGHATAVGTFVPVAPVRVLDSRVPTGPLCACALASGQTLRLPVPGTSGPVGGVVLNVTVTAPQAAGYITAYPDGASLPTASNVNFVAGQTVPNLVSVAAGLDGAVDLYNGTLGGTTQLIADLAGYYVGQPSTSLTPPGSTVTSQAAQQVVRAVNSARVAYGRPALTVDNGLVGTAHNHNLRMAQANTMSHQLPNEPTLGTRLDTAGVSWRYCEENIGWNSDLSVNGALALHDAMMAEGPPTTGQSNHYSNILSPDVRRIGVDVSYDPVHGKIWLTEDFAG